MNYSTKGNILNLYTNKNKKDKIRIDFAVSQQ